MKFNLYLIFIALLLCSKSSIAQNYPGGVTGAEVWYIVNEDDVENHIFSNSAQTGIPLFQCESFNTSLFNFNPSIYGNICLSYNGSLENSTGRNVFFVGEPINTEDTFSHLGTLWNSNLGSILDPSIIVENFFDVNNNNFFNNYISEAFTSNQNARVNFYNINNYNINRKFKSYGQIGETTFYIGKLTQFDTEGDYSDSGFKGNFPEFISFSRELSVNERDRVESYLALKYGLTLDPKLSYRNSSNIVFWNRFNNDRFGNRIFGFGRDVVSGLHQLQSESTHFKNFLVSAVGEILVNNTEQQEEMELPDGDFLVFGDDSGKLFISPTKVTIQGIQLIDRIWLAQATGNKSKFQEVAFKLNFSNELLDVWNYLNVNSDKTLWLIKDNYVNNTDLSDFDGQNIEYYEVADLDLNLGIGMFEHVSFDPDDNDYDQFTFGVGAKMIVQAQQDCKGGLVNIVINGGEGPYEITLTPEEGEGDPEYYVVEEGNEYEIGVEVNVNYLVTVVSSNNITSTTTFITHPGSLNLDLGPDQNLSSSQPEIILDAGNFSNVTYRWYKNDELIPGESGSTYTVTEGGSYKVVVTSDNGVCVFDDTIQIGKSDLYVYYEVESACDEEFNVVNVVVSEGIGPFITTVQGSNTNYSQVHNDDTVIDNLAYGNYTITTIDSFGNDHSVSFMFEEPNDFLLNESNDFGVQLQAICNTCYDVNTEIFVYNNNYTVDASLLHPPGNVNYEWFANGVSLGVYTPQLTISVEIDDCHDIYFGYIEYSVVITNPVTLCTITDSFVSKIGCPDVGAKDMADTDTNEPVAVNRTTLNTKVFPNPSYQGRNFNYEAYSEENFEGIVQLVSMTGAVLGTWQLHGNSTYNLQMHTLSAGMYLVKLTTEKGIKIDRVIIK